MPGVAAVGLVNELHAEGRRDVTDDDLDGLRNVCRCGTYPRIREAIREGAAHMPMAAAKPKRKKKHRAKHHRPAHRTHSG